MWPSFLPRFVSHRPAALLYISRVLRTGLTSMLPSHRCTKRYILVFHPLQLPFFSPDDLVELEGRFQVSSSSIPQSKSRC
ncbi:hypothetical protein BGW80DRAFT_1307605 [Lactifluus volemus]|nr:hypothetical protein BGW80DRAFT_1307605 [Lactifluus volemus]